MTVSPYSSEVWIYDGMVMLQKMEKVGASTFGDVSTKENCDEQPNCILRYRPIY